MKKLILLILILIISSVPAHAQNTEDVYEPFEEAITSEGVSYEMDGSILLPSSYNARSLGMTTSVKDQGDRPFCMTYARIAALETALIKKGYENTSVDLSEVHMLYERWQSSGSTNTFGKWYAYSYNQSYGLESSFDNSFQLRPFPVYESQMPMTTITDGYMPDTTYVGTSPYEISTIYLYKAESDATEADNIRATKEGIYQYGSVAANISYVPESEDDASYRFFGNGQDYTYYLPQKKSTGIGHVVQIVGWDDSYSKNNFSSKPQADGAWLCKNSWGNIGGSSGYFWMSYYSKVSIIWEAFDVAKKGTTARGIEAATGDITLYVGQTSDPVSVKMTPNTADPIEWYIDIPANDEYLTVNADHSITCKKYPVSEYSTDQQGSAIRTVKIRSKDKRLNFTASVKVTMKANTIDHTGTVMIPDTGKVDITEGISVSPVSSQKSDITYERGSTVNIENNRYAIGRSYGEGSVKARLDGQSVNIPCYVYCTGFELGEDLESDGSVNAFLSPVFALENGKDKLIELITYSSSDELVARVEGDCVYFTGNGQAKITATLLDEKLTNGVTLTDSITVTVTGMDTESVTQIVSNDPVNTDPIIEEPAPYVDPYAYQQEVSNEQIQSGKLPEPAKTDNTSKKPAKKTEKTPSKVTIRSVKAKSGGKAALKWENASGAYRYEIQVSADKGFKNAASFYTKKAKYTVKGLASGAKYYIRIRALGKRKTGKWSKKKSVRTS